MAANNADMDIFFHFSTVAPAILKAPTSKHVLPFLPFPGHHRPQARRLHVPLLLQRRAPRQAEQAGGGAAAGQEGGGGQRSARIVPLGNVIFFNFFEGVTDMNIDYFLFRWPTAARTLSCSARNIESSTSTTTSQVRKKNI